MLLYHGEAGILATMSQIVLHTYGNSNKTIVMLPGWKYPVEKEPKFIETLSKKYTLVTVQLPGYWDNPDAFAFLDFSELAKIILAELKMQNIVPSAWIGFSMGCKLLMEIERDSPSTVPNIFVGCPQGKYETPPWAQVLLKSRWIISLLRRSSIIKRFVVATALKFLKNRDIDGVTLTGAFDSLVALLRSSVEVTSKSVHALYLYGNQDRYVPIAQKKSLPNIAIIHNAPHNCVRDHEEEVVRIIEKALT